MAGVENNNSRRVIDDFIKLGLDNVNKELIQHRDQVQRGFDSINLTLSIIQKDYRSLNGEIKDLISNCHTTTTKIRERIDTLEDNIENRKNGKNILFKWIWKFLGGGV